MRYYFNRVPAVPYEDAEALMSSLTVESSSMSKSLVRGIVTEVFSGNRELSPATLEEACAFGAYQSAGGVDATSVVGAFAALQDRLVAATVAERHGRVAHVTTKLLQRCIAAHVAHQHAVARSADRGGSGVPETAVGRGGSECRRVFDALPFLISFVTADERYGMVNKAYESWFGISAEDLVGRRVRDVIGPSAYAALEPYVRRGLAGEPVTFEQFGVPYRLGGARDIRVTFVPRSDGDVVDGYVAILEDITALRTLESKHEKLARQSTEFLEAINDGYFALDSDWRFTQVNRSFEEVAGVARANALGRTFADMFPDAARSDSAYFQNYDLCMRTRTETRFVAHNAVRDLWLDIRALPMSDGGISVFFRDVSTETRSGIVRSERAAFEEQLIGIVSHDLRNPLNVISLAARYLLEAGELPPGATKNVVRIESASDRALRLVRDLLDFTQARLGGGIRIDKNPIDLRHVVNDVIEEVRSTYPNRKIDVTHEGDGSGDGDYDRLAQVVQNLATNALKYSPSDGVVTISTRGASDRIELSIHNRGEPIPAEKIATLFEPYERGAATHDSATRSVGLGLHIVRMIVQAHGGSVQVSSTESSGTTFVVSVPR